MIKLRESNKNIEAEKLKSLQSRAFRAKEDIMSSHLIDGESFLDELEAGDHD